MAVRLDPDQIITFERPLTRIVKSSIDIYNDSNEPVVFKVKTTAPKTYCVRPNVGRVAPFSYLTVQVLLQPFKEEPPSDFVCKDKFLILSMPATDSDATTSDDIHRLWSIAEASDKKKNISQAKLRCVYASPADGAVKEKVAPAPAAPPSESIPAIEQAIEDRELRVTNGSVEKPAVSAPSSAVEARDEAQHAVADLRAKLEAYEKELSELRQRKVQQPEPVLAAAAPQPSVQTVRTNGGYPVHILILVALVSFAVAYFLLAKQ